MGIPSESLVIDASKELQKYLLWITFASTI